MPRFVVVILIVFLFTGCSPAKEYPSVDNLPKSEGVIHHPTYGDYPEKVEFEQGMTLMPGQMASMEMVIDVPNEWFEEREGE